MTYSSRGGEGIYQDTRLGWIECRLCGLEMRNHALTRASHGKKHVREGEATTRVEFTYDGPRTVYEPVVRMAPEMTPQEIIDFREAMGWSQERLAMTLDPPVQQGTVSRWESGERRIPAGLRQALRMLEIDHQNGGN